MKKKKQYQMSGGGLREKGRMAGDKREESKRMLEWQPPGQETVKQDTCVRLH